MEELFNNSDIRNAVILFIVGTIAGVGAILAAFGVWLRRKLESDSYSHIAETEKEQAEARMLNTAADALNDLVVNSAEERAEFLRTLNKLLDDNRELREQVAKLQDEHNLLKVDFAKIQEQLQSSLTAQREAEKARDKAEAERDKAQAETKRVRDEYHTERQMMSDKITKLESRIDELARQEKSA